MARFAGSAQHLVCLAVQAKIRYYTEVERAEDRVTGVKSVFDQIDDEAEARAIAEAEAEFDAGEGVPHEKVREWLLKLARGEITPPPCE
jgi:predicted transcriptional regulator